MRKRRVRFLQVGVATALALGLTTVVSTTAWAYTATGSVTCGQVRGGVTFAPTLNTGHNFVRERITVKAFWNAPTSCTTTGSNATSITRMELVARWTLTGPGVAQCPLATPTAGTQVITPFKIIWRGLPRGIAPTVFANTGESWVLGGSPSLTFSASGDTGSFAGTQHTVGFTLGDDPCTTPGHEVPITGFTSGSLTLG